jgi:predicted phosphodiesterase
LIGILSDIHGNYVALSAVLREIDRLEVSTLICLGDTAGYYNQINECCEALRARDVFSLMGNHDQYITSNDGCPRSDSATRCIEYQASIIDTSHLAWLASLQSSAQIHGLDLVHGGWNDPLEEYMTPTTEYFEGLDGPTFASGHTHEQMMWNDGLKQYCNPGSVGQPRDGDPRSAFATWDGLNFELHRVEYDVSATQHSMTSAGFDPYFSDNLAFGLRIGAHP